MPLVVRTNNDVRPRLRDRAAACFACFQVWNIRYGTNFPKQFGALWRCMCPMLTALDWGSLRFQWLSWLRYVCPPIHPIAWTLGLKHPNASRRIDCMTLSYKNGSRRSTSLSKQPIIDGHLPRKDCSVKSRPQKAGSCRSEHIATYDCQTNLARWCSMREFNGGQHTLSSG